MAAASRSLWLHVLGFRYFEFVHSNGDVLATLEASVGAQSGQLGNIDVWSGAPAIYFHAYPHVMEHDAYSGDYGLGFFGSSLEASATLVIDPLLGPLCIERREDRLPGSLHRRGLLLATAVVTLQLLVVPHR